MAITVSGILRSPQGLALQNAELLFEQTRTTEEVLQGTKFSINTQLDGAYASTLGVGIFTFKIRFQEETDYRTIASNIIVSPAMDNYSINQIIQDQSQMQDVDYDLLQAVLQARDTQVQQATEASQSQGQAQSSQTESQTSQATSQQQQQQQTASQVQQNASQVQQNTSQTQQALSQDKAKGSETQSQQSQTSADSSAQQAYNSSVTQSQSAVAAGQSKDQAQLSETSQQSSQYQAQASQTSALSSEQNQLQSKNQAKLSETNAQGSSQAQLISQNQQAQSQNTAGLSEAQALSSKTQAANSQDAQYSSAQSALANKDEAREWASKPEDQVVQDGLFSSRHYAAKAAGYAQTQLGQLIWRGGWSAQSGNTPPTPTGSTQDFYRITQSGTILGVSYDIGDYIHWDTINSIWFKMDGTDSVISVNGKAGQVVLTQQNVGAVTSHVWDATIKLGTWSSICRFTTTALGGKATITVGHTRGAVVVNARFLVSWGHAGHGTITQLESHGYTQIQVRVAMVGDSAEFEILDTDYGTTQEGTDVVYTCSVDNLYGGVEKYGSFTASTGVPHDVTQTEYLAIKINNNKVFHQGFKPSAAEVGAFPITGGQLGGPVHAKHYVLAESMNGQNWTGLGATDDSLPWISAKVNGSERKVLEFGADLTTVTTNLHINGGAKLGAWGTVIETIGGKIRSDNTSFTALDGKTYSFVTSPMDAHLCQNSYWDGSSWIKYDTSSPSGHLVVSGGALQFHSSDAGNPNPLQKAYDVYHTGHRPTPAEIGAAAVTEVYSKGHIDEKSWTRVADLRNAVRPPNSFNERSITAWFNETGNPTAGWYSGINVRGWAEDHASWELLSGSDFPGAHAADAYKTALWFRSGHGATWGEFQKVYTSLHKPTPAEIGAIPTNTANGTPVATYFLDNTSSNMGTKIRLPFNVNSLKMVLFTVRVYQDYQSHDIQFSGYLYDQINNWYAPNAIMIAGSSQVSYAMGRDDDGRAYVWIGGNNYRGVGVFDVVGGFNHADWNTGWEISVSDHKPNLVMEGVVYPPYSPANKPTSEQLNVIGINKKNYLNNTDQVGVGFIAAREAGAGWVATYHGSDAGDKVVMGSLSGKPTIGGHIPDCTNWADLYINTQHGHVGISSSTIIGNPYAKNTDDNAVYRVYHEGFKPTALGIGAAPDGFGVGGYCATIGTVLGDCNLRRQGGFFNGPSIEGIPAGGHAWKYVINVCHDNPAGYFGYIAFDLDLGHAWLGGQSGGLQKSKKFVFQQDRIVGQTGGNTYDYSGLETITLNGTSFAPSVSFHKAGVYAGMIQMTNINEFALVDGLNTVHVNLVAGNINANDVYIRSDARLKTNLVKLGGALEKVSALTAYSYDKKNKLSATNYDKHEVGLIAQDVEKVLPEAINRIVDSTDDCGEEVLTISTPAITALLVEAIKELKAELEDLRRKLNGS